MAHTLKDETLKFAIRGVVVVGLVGEVDDAGFVSGVLRKEEEVDQEGGLLSEISCDGGGDSDDVAYEVAEGEVGVEEGFVDSVGVGTDLVEGKGLAMVHDHPGGGGEGYSVQRRGEGKKKNYSPRKHSPWPTNQQYAPSFLVESSNAPSESPSELVQLSSLPLAVPIRCEAKC